ncbi:MAG: 23S rRNA (guanosine(2251)-2'-O)-methyltransferase RlmB [Anaerolineales bacterium]|nr:23S rRNA (guanosine(2251)-2'-O)-methyltransferase RlmB [Anaerolineales bacterium]
MGDGEWIYGRNPVLEVMRAGSREVQKIRIASGVEMAGPLAEIMERAERNGVGVDRLPRAELDRVTDNHQGVLALASEYRYVSLDEILGHASSTEEAPFLLLLDMVQDPQNLGTLLRTAEAVGVHGVIIPTKRSATVTPAVVSASSGASEHIRIAQHNLAQAIRTLKEQGVWVAGLEGARQARPLQEVDLSGPIALVVGHEGSGMRRLVQESCDYLVRIPMRGSVESLNAAVAGSIALFHVWQKREFPGASA